MTERRPNVTVPLITPSSDASIAKVSPDPSTIEDKPGKVVFSEPSHPGKGEASEPHRLDMMTGTPSISA